VRIREAGRPDRDPPAASVVFVSSAVEREIGISPGVPVRMQRMARENRSGPCGGVNDRRFPNISLRDRLAG
jgi:hypothetical protein